MPLEELTTPATTSIPHINTKEERGVEEEEHLIRERESEFSHTTTTMAVDSCTDTFTWAIDPRISFSHNLNQFDAIPIDPHRPHPDPSPDFDFCVFGTSDHESSSADELFSGGKILPMQFKSPVVVFVGPSTTEQPAPPPVPRSSPPSPARQDRKKKKKSSRETSPERPGSFCFFRRSSSYSSGNGHKSSSIWSLQLLSRSNSTGSTDQSSRNPNFKDTQKASVQKPALGSSSISNSDSGSLQKPPLKKNCSSQAVGKSTGQLFGSYGNGVRFSPVLNIPPPYISKGTTSLLGFGYFFSNNRKERNTKKKSFHFQSKH